MSWTCIHADRSAQIVNMWNGLKTLKLTETNNTKQKKQKLSKGQDCCWSKSTTSVKRAHFRVLLSTRYMPLLQTWWFENVASAHCLNLSKCNEGKRIFTREKQPKRHRLSSRLWCNFCTNESGFHCPSMHQVSQKNFITRHRAQA